MVNLEPGFHHVANSDLVLRSSHFLTIVWMPESTILNFDVVRSACALAEAIYSGSFGAYNDEKWPPDVVGCMPLEVELVGFCTHSPLIERNGVQGTPGLGDEMKKANEWARRKMTEEELAVYLAQSKRENKLFNGS